MNGRRSFDPTNAKPFNINIFYNINSKNITNNHQVQSHPVTARINKNILQQDQTIPYKNQTKSKTSKLRKKKYSADLGMPTDRKTEKIGKKSNNVSICSGFPSQNNFKKDNQKLVVGKKSLNYKKFDKSEKKLSHLLQIFSEGKINKEKLTKQIMEIFEYKGQDETKQKKITKKKKSQSTLIGNTTPKNNQMLRLNSAHVNNMRTVMNVHNLRRKQSKSQRSSFSNTNKQIIRQQVVKQIIQSKAINSSLFLQPDDDQKNFTVYLPQQNDVQTSQSIILLNQNMKKQTEKYQRYIMKPQKKRNFQQEMAIKIQRAWRKYRTKVIIKCMLNPKVSIVPTDPNSYLQKIQCVSGKSEMQVQNFLSQQLTRKNVIRESQIAKVEQLRDHQLKKWNQIMNYVKISINNKSLSSGQCLMQIIDYFENAKKTVQKQLQLQNFKNRQKCCKQEISHRESREITQFTNKAFSKQIQNNQNIKQSQQKLQQQLNDDEQYEQISYGQEQNQKQLNQQGVQEINDKLDPINSISQSVSHSSSDTQIRNQFQNMINRKSDDLSFQIVQTVLIQYYKKLDLQHLQKIKKLDIHSTNYLETKKKLQQKFKQSKKQLKRIISNLNKGYMQAKSILEKQLCLQSQENLKHSSSSNDRQMLQKCKSDNYLLKTAINYKKYIQKRQKNQKFVNRREVNNSNESEQNEKILTKVKNKDNLELKSGGSSEFSDVSMIKKLKQVIEPQENQQQNNELQNKSDPFQISQFQGGEGVVTNQAQIRYNKLQQKIVSQEFLQYQEIHKKFDEEDQRLSNSICSNDNKVNAEQISLFQNTKLNQINKKFKFLTSQDKDDIFQFLFIDLTLELITQYEQQTKVYKAIKRYVQRKKKLQGIPKGVKTNLQACKQYLNSLSRVITTDFSDMFQKHIVVPMGPSARQMLKYMHDEDQNQDFEQDQDLNVPLILPVIIFDKIQSKCISEYPRYYDDDARELPRVKFLKSVQHIHHKAVFDALNQSLDAQRPYGIWGVPFPWKTTHKNNKNFDWEGKKKLVKLQRGIQKVVHCCSYMCGILSDKQDNVFNNHKVSQHYVEQIREDRMSKMLANQLLENQDRWAFYDDEETQVIIELSRIFTLVLVQQFANQFLRGFIKR